MQKAVEAQTAPTLFGFINELRKCEIIMPKKTIATPVAAAASAEADEVLLQKLATKIAVIQGRSGRAKGSDMESKEKFVGRCFHCEKVGHKKQVVLLLKDLFLKPK